MKRYTPTQISTFEICPKRYQFKYLDRLRKPVKNAEAFMGKRVHETLEKLYTDILLSKGNSIKDLLEFYHERWEKHWHSGIQIIRKEYSEKNYFLTGERCIKDYYKSYTPFDKGKTIGVDLKIEIPLNATGRSIVGFIDRLVYLGRGHFEVHDYKVSSTFPDHAKVEQEKQLPLFQLAINEMWREVNQVQLVSHFLAFDKDITSKSSDSIEGLKEKITATIDNIESTSEFVPVENPLCQSCDYKPICPLWKHLFKTKSLPIKKNIKEDGVSLVNRFVTLMEQKKRINDELREIKEAIATYTDNEGIENIFGTNYKLRVRRKKRFKFPSLSKDTEKMQEIEEWLKKNKKWDEVSKLDFDILENVLKEKTWKEKHLNELKDFAIEEKRAYFSPSKLNEEE